MTFQNRLDTFIELGKQLRELPAAQLDEWYFRATGFNNWFTRESVASAVQAIGQMLQEDKLKKWTDKYPKNISSQKTVALIMAGNIPLVGFHDYLCILLSGHKIIAKLSSQDPYLIKEITQMIINIEADFENRITLTQDQLNGFDAIIATGSDNSARYFHQYFGKYPHIIRKNRTSVGILNGQETTEELQKLGHDMFQYYGLGCRNVSKLFVPEGYDFVPFIKSMDSFDNLRDHHKWVNNYDYNKSIYLVNREDHFDSGTFLMKESKDWVSPISVIFYEFYDDKKDLAQLLKDNESIIQCVVGQGEKMIPPGEAQQPELWDYADGVDTMEFLTKTI